MLIMKGLRRLSGLSVEKVFLKEHQGFRLDVVQLESELKGDELVFLGQPNNPTGLPCDVEALRDLAGKHPSTVFIVDEAFADFVEDRNRLACDRPSNVIVLCSLTDLDRHSRLTPGMRHGGPAHRCESAPCHAALDGEHPGPGGRGGGVARCRLRRTDPDFVRNLRERLTAELLAIPGLTVYPGAANFLLVRLDRTDIDAPTLARRLLARGLAIRVCDNFDGLDARFFRLAVRTGEENLRLCQALRETLGIPGRRPAGARRTPAIMFQGTSSNAGKSILTAALCRILLQDGYRVAPFKSQNMALNSFVTRDGGEMGRAQVVQAQACRLDPDVRMNPILLKPSSDTGAQVIVDGQPVGNMDVTQYIRFKPEAFARAKEAFASLCQEHDVIVIEGAGSPGEVNLKHHDIVNMRMAQHAAAPVLLVGDIDRGGVFASFVGTMEVLAEWERKLVAGFVINKFRGKQELLDDALTFTRRHTGRPVLGVVPYLSGLGLPEEDSVGFKSGAFDAPSPRDDAVEIAVIDLPHISNFTDFDALRIEPDVQVRIVRSPQELNQPDAVILPGSKNVIADLAHLRRTGLDRPIADLARQGKVEMIGICGGFQMLGEEISDPYEIESGGATLRGLGLLPVRTVLAREKTLTRVEAIHLPSTLTVQGYEIHHGQTAGDGLAPAVRRWDGEAIGAGLEQGRIWGTYLHGLFDADEFRRWFIDQLRMRRGLPALGRVCASYDLEPAFERLAAAVRGCLNIKDIYRMMGLC